MESLAADIHKRSAPVEIVVAKEAIPAGGSFSDQNLAKKSVPESGTGRRNIPAKEFELLLGARAKIEIAEGEPVFWSDVDEPFEVEKFSMAIPAGRLALALSADLNTSFSGLLRPGDAVDLLCGDPRGGGGSWIRSIPVIAVDRFYKGQSPNEEPAEAATITLSVTPDEGRKIAAATRDGRLNWFLRNPDDRRPGPADRSVPPGEDPNRVEIWKGGRLQTLAAKLMGEIQ